MADYIAKLEALGLSRDKGLTRWPANENGRR